jgi:hypothetical protein
MMDPACYRTQDVSDSFQIAVATLSGERGESRAGKSPLDAGRVVQTGIKNIKIIYDNPSKQSEDHYGGDPSEDVGAPLPPVLDQQPIHVSPKNVHAQCTHCRPLHNSFPPFIVS